MTDQAKTDQTKSRNIVVRLLGGIWRGLDGLRKVTHFFLMLFVLLAFLSAISGSAPTMPRSAVLSLQPAGVLVEELAGSAYDRAIAELLDNAAPQTLISDVVDALAYAKEDDRIKGVHLELSRFGGGSTAKLAMVADAIRDFQSSGKPVIASADGYSQGSYYLASLADEVYMHPDGIVFMQGFGSYRAYFSEAIDKLKIDWNIFRVGKYKSFVEPYTRMDMSEESREATSRVIEQLWDGYLRDVESARGIDEGSIREMVANFDDLVVENGGDIAAIASEYGLLDGLRDREAIRERLIDLAGTDDELDDAPSAVDLTAYLDFMRMLKPEDRADANVAIVVAAGQILDGSQPPGQVGGDSTAGLLRRALRDDSVKAVVLRVDSPGGSAFASEVISNAVENLQAAGKPVIASMSGVAASGGYWISAKADKIYASPSTITGSIGILGMFPTFQRTAAYLGVNIDGVGSTKWAGQLRPDREMSEPARRVFQQVINHGYDEFLEQVATGRNMSINAVHEIAQGRIWTGLDALNRGLVDELGDLDAAVAAAAAEAGLEEGEYGSFVVEEPLSSTEQMIVDLLATAKALGVDPAVFVDEPRSLERLARQFEAMIDPVLRFNDPNGVYAHCFCRFE
ncbi:MAG: signal peptide peptidase SppA [Woeseiaceae bacterium]|jgi:protease-4|nr:signal peptide peptidase SppA [Woeseiaceae bacterium]